MSLHTQDLCKSTIFLNQGISSQKLKLQLRLIKKY